MTVRVDEAAAEVLRTALMGPVGAWGSDFVRAARAEVPARAVRLRLARFRLRGLGDGAAVRAACTLVDVDPVTVLGRLHEQLCRAVDDIIEGTAPDQTPGVIIDLVSLEWPRHVRRFADEIVHTSLNLNGGSHG